MKITRKMSYMEREYKTKTKWGEWARQTQNTMVMRVLKLISVVFRTRCGSVISAWHRC